MVRTRTKGTNKLLRDDLFRTEGELQKVGTFAIFCNLTKPPSQRRREQKLIVTGAGEMAQSVKFLPCKRGDLSLDPQYPDKGQAWRLSCNPGAGGGPETGGLPEFVGQLHTYVHSHTNHIHVCVCVCVYSHPPHIYIYTYIRIYIHTLPQTYLHILTIVLKDR